MSEEQKPGLTNLRPKISIIVLNYNNKEWSKKCLNSLLNTRHLNYEIIFVDNGSTDGSLDFIRKEFSQTSLIKFVSLPKNLQYAGGNNEGLKYAVGDYIVFLNNDTIVKPDWLSELEKCMEKDETIGICQSKLLLYDYPTKIDSTGDFLNLLGFSVMQGRFEENYGQYDKNTDIFSARGACLMIRKSLIKKIGAFDPLYQSIFEDLDLCWRARLAGYKIKLVPSSIVYHKGRATTKGNVGREAFLSSRNLVITFIKNLELINLFKFVLLFMITRVIGYTLLIFLRHKHRKVWLIYFIEFIKAQLWILRNFRIIWSKRVIIQRYIRKVSDREILPYFKSTRMNLAYFFKWIIEHEN